MIYQKEFFFIKHLEKEAPISFPLYDGLSIICCPQHIEAKKLANKLSNRIETTHWRLEKILYKEKWDDEDQKRFNGLFQKIEKLEVELQSIIRGLKKCGCH